MCRVDEVIARKEISVVLDDGNVAAYLPKDAQGVLLPEGGSGRLFEHLNCDPLDILAHPFVEDRAEKISPSWSGNTAVADSALSVWFDERQEFNIPGL